MGENYVGREGTVQGRRGAGLWEENEWMLTRVCTIERDSRKDEAVVFVFIFATAGLLGWALIRTWVERWVEVLLSTPGISEE